MSKEVVVFDIETVEKIKGALFLLSSLALANRLPQLTEIDNLRRIVKAKFFEAKQGQMRFSVLEWHPVTERPLERKPLITRYDNSPHCGIICGDVSFDFFFDQAKHAKEWAYLPE
ncbi:hypothetical protein IAI58_19155 (plasmid) [Roseomonas marmotae]|uniref:hypothetical protein n=1 Tax=Roseomonas marmotae TaxID=2768161 RepID=UPI001AD66DC2|nr:hypothetical protein [Roseomonas marmotae]QTI81462.1 hypothetical protein IAI58_19155 [Roseomonas marmotae]